MQPSISTFSTYSKARNRPSKIVNRNIASNPVASAASGNSDCAERLRSNAINHELEVDTAIWQLHQIDGLKFIDKFAHKVWSILATEAERDDRAGVTEHSVAHVGFKLLEILVRNGESDAILTELGEHICDGECREGLKFIDIDKEIAPLLRRQIRAAVCSQADRRDEQSAEERGAILSDPTFGKIDQKNLTFVHDRSDVQIMFR